MFWPNHANVFAIFVLCFILIFMVLYVGIALKVYWSFRGQVIVRSIISLITIGIATALWLALVWIADFFATATPAGGLSMCGVILCVLIIASIAKRSMKENLIRKGLLQE